MSRMRTLKSYTIKIDEGEDERGAYVKYKHSYERYCSCRPETYPHFGEKVTISEVFKIYDDGSKEDIEII